MLLCPTSNETGINMRMPLRMRKRMQRRKRKKGMSSENNIVSHNFVCTHKKIHSSIIQLIHLFNIQLIFLSATAFYHDFAVDVKLLKIVSVAIPLCFNDKRTNEGGQNIIICKIILHYLTVQW